MGKPSWYNQPPRSTQPFVLPWSINEYWQYAGGKGVRITSVGWQVILCDPLWHVVSRAHYRFVNIYVLYNWQRFSRLSQLTVRQVSQSYTQRLTPGTTTVPLCTALWSISTGWQVANEIA